MGVRISNDLQLFGIGIELGILLIRFILFYNSSKFSTHTQTLTRHSHNDALRTWIEKNSGKWLKNVNFSVCLAAHTHTHTVKIAERNAEEENPVP